MGKVFINTKELNTVSECLEQLALAEESIIAIDGQLLKYVADPEWRKRAENARRTMGVKKRIVCARLAVLRQQEKERNVQMHQRRNGYLVYELKQIVTPSDFEECVRRVDAKMEASNG